MGNTSRSCHPDSWSGTVCAGEFVGVQVAAGGFNWGGEQSCTSPEAQTLEFLLLNSNGDVVGAPYKARTGYQGYIHESTHCTSSTLSVWKEDACGTARGVQPQPYPALKPFERNCYAPGRRRLRNAVQATPIGSGSPRASGALFSGRLRTRGGRQDARDVLNEETLAFANDVLTEAERIVPLELAQRFERLTKRVQRQRRLDTTEATELVTAYPAVAGLKELAVRLGVRREG